MLKTLSFFYGYQKMCSNSAQQPSSVIFSELQTRFNCISKMVIVNTVYTIFHILFSGLNHIPLKQ